MTDEAARFQDRLDVAGEIYAHLCLRRQLPCADACVFPQRRNAGESQGKQDQFENAPSRHLKSSENQKDNLAFSWIVRAPRVEVKRPKLVFVMLVLIPEKLVRLNELNMSARICKFQRSVNSSFLANARSMFQ